MSDQTDQDHHESHGGYGLYIGVFIALCVLTTFSFLTYFDFWRNHVPVNISRAFMMAVSCTKAMLVIMFFMHLKWEANWKWVLTAPVIVMSALLMFALVPDVGLRFRHASEDRMIYAAERPANTVQPYVDEAPHEDGHEHEADAERPAA
jgi:cytochrome c oxidase subunit 4